MKLRGAPEADAAPRPRSTSSRDEEAGHPHSRRLRLWRARGPPLPEPQPAPPTVQTPEPSPAPPSREALEQPDWRWEGPPLEEIRFPAPPVTIQDPGGLRCRFGYDDEASSSNLSCERAGREVWSRRRGAFVAGAALSRWGETLLVARFSHISSGCAVTAYDIDTGVERWRRSLLGVGPIGHSEYFNAVQMAVEEDRVVVRGWEIAGKYIEVLDVQNGGVLGNWREENGAFRQTEVQADPALSDPARVPEGAASGVPWRWDGATMPQWSRAHEVSVPAAGGRCRFATGERRAVLECLNPDGDRRWGDSLADEYQPGAALLAHGDTLYVARFHPIASGCVVTAYDLARGHERWSRPLWGVGPIDHSGYANRVRVERDGGRLVVYGWELAGRYVEVLDLSTGRVLGQRVEPPGP